MKRKLCTLFFMLGTACSANFLDDQTDIMLDSARKGACAAVALAPPFQFLMQKTALQLSDTTPISFRTSAYQGMKAMPNTFLAITCQLYSEKIGQNLFENVVPDRMLSFASCGVGAFVSAPLYDVMNRQTKGNCTMGQAFYGYLRNPVTTLPLVLREYCFLLSLQASKPIAHTTQEKFGSNVFLNNFSHFLVGGFGSLCGYPFDSMVSMLQHTQKPFQMCMKNSFTKNGMKGWAHKSVGVGIFNILYQNLERVTCP